MNEKIIVAYHGHCLDGFSGAWAAWKKFGDTADYIPLVRDEDPPFEVFAGRQVYCIDFCYPVAIMREVVARAAHVTVLDHHKTQKEALSTAQESRYALDRSGCMLAWDYFHPDQPAPALLAIIQDNDLYTLLLPHTRTFISYIATGDMDFARWDALAAEFENPSLRDGLFEKGSLILETQRRLADNMLSSAEYVRFEGYEVLAINTQTLYSDVANALYTTTSSPFGITWYYKQGKLHISLRSNGVVDVSELALRYGGGGHAGAAGFILPFQGTFPWEVLTHSSMNQSYDRGSNLSTDDQRAFTHDNAS